MTAAERLKPPAEPPALRLLERPPRSAPLPPVPAPPVWWQRWAEAWRRPR